MKFETTTTRRDDKHRSVPPGRGENLKVNQGQIEAGEHRRKVEDRSESMTSQSRRNGWGRGMSRGDKEVGGARNAHLLQHPTRKE
jgi:hypothetical protein